MMELPRISIVASDSNNNGIQGEFSSLSLGQGLHRAWTYLMLFSSTTIFKSPILVSSHNFHVEINCFYLICILVTIATLLLIGIFNTKSIRVLLSEKTILVASALCAAGTAIAMFGQIEGALALPASIFSGFACGISNAFLIIFWGMTFARHEIMSIVINTAISIIIGVIIFAIVLFLGSSLWGIIAAAAIPLLELPFIRHFLHRSNDAFANQPKPNYLPTKTKLLGIRFAIPLFLFGFALGIIRYFTVSSVFDTHGILLYLLSVFAGSAIMVILLIIVCFYAESLAGESLLRYMVPILIASVLFLTLPILTDLPIVAPLLLVCYLYFIALIWIFLCCTCSRFRLSPFFVIGIGYALLNLGMFLAGFSLVAYDAVSADNTLSESTLLALAIIAMVIAYALLPRMADIARITESSVAFPTSKSSSKGSRLHHGKNQDDEPKHNVQHSIDKPVDKGGESAVDDAQSVAFPSQIPSQPNEAAEIPRERTSKPVRNKAQEQSGTQANVFRIRCNEISDKYLLSRRESEVLYLLARGHGVSYIQDKLCIAQSTTKTHIYHIYQKLGIHTQQELINMVMDEIED